MDLKKLKESIKTYSDKAILIACTLHNYNESNVDYVSFDEDYAEVHFSIDSGCSCCGDEEYIISVPLKDLFQDIDLLIKEKEQERLEKKLKTELSMKIREENQKEEKEKYDREQYEKLKQKFDK